MKQHYSETTDWAGAAWALTVWAAHFTLLWTASSIWPGEAAARWAALVVTVAALGALAILWRTRVGGPRFSIPALGIAMAAAAIFFGSLPALVG